PVAGKTGTSDRSNETWFVGYTPQLTTAVWVGTPDDRGNKRILRNLQLGDTFYGGQVFGATIAAPIWKRIMDRASAGMPFLDFAEPATIVQSGDMVPIPNVAGMTVSDSMAALTAAEFNPVVGSAVNSAIPVGRAVDTQPSYEALRGSQVVIMTSKGVVPPPTAAPGPVVPNRRDGKPNKRRH
ncbi:MAG: PASTA domain-containing protein, partial [Actinobacteria bacterium]|nr:PASTA domain-containing protein [Actinomycetota bacterium]